MEKTPHTIMWEMLQKGLLKPLLFGEFTDSPILGLTLYQNSGQMEIVFLITFGMTEQVCLILKEEL